MEKGYGLGEPPEEYKAPSWSTSRSNYWKAQAKKAGAVEKWGEKYIEKMKEGKSPIKDGQKMELHHPKGRKGRNIEYFKPMPQDEHRGFHKDNGYRYDDVRGWH